MVSCVLFFKQKTAYEMRISDWSSDVCSSDLAPEIGIKLPYHAQPNTVICNGEQSPSWYRLANVFGRTTVEWPGYMPKPPINSVSKRSEERREGKECVSTCRSRRGPYQ